VRYLLLESYAVMCPWPLTFSQCLNCQKRSGGTLEARRRRRRDERRRRENRGAVGAEGGWGGVSPPQPTRGSGERREFPQRGPGWSPGRKRIWCILWPLEGRWWQLNCLIGFIISTAVVHSHYYFECCKSTIMWLRLIG